jgi:hypothetical protein
MSWQEQLNTSNQSWRAVVDYARERIAELTTICISTESTDSQIRQAQAGVLELQRLISLPDILAATAQIRGQMTGRKEY